MCVGWGADRKDAVLHKSKINISQASIFYYFGFWDYEYEEIQFCPTLNEILALCIYKTNKRKRYIDIGEKSQRQCHSSSDIS